MVESGEPARRPGQRSPVQARPGRRADPFGGGFPFFGGGFQQQQQQQQATGGGSVLLLPAAAAERDPHVRVGPAVPVLRGADQGARHQEHQLSRSAIPLKKASAQQVATYLTQFYATALPGHGGRAEPDPLHLRHQQQHRLRPGRAGRHGGDPGDHRAARHERVAATNELRIVRLRNAPAEELAATLANGPDAEHPAARGRRGSPSRRAAGGAPGGLPFGGGPFGGGQPFGQQQPGPSRSAVGHSARRSAGCARPPARWPADKHDQDRLAPVPHPRQGRHVRVRVPGRRPHHAGRPVQQPDHLRPEADARPARGGDQEPRRADRGPVPGEHLHPEAGGRHADREPAPAALQRRTTAAAGQQTRCGPFGQQPFGAAGGQQGLRPAV